MEAQVRSRHTVVEKDSSVARGERCQPSPSFANSSGSREAKPRALGVNGVKPAWECPDW
jgi:hypothetical protein